MTTTESQSAENHRGNGSSEADGGASKDADKFPILATAPAYLSIFSFFFSLLMVMPFLPFMTKDFVDRPRNELGYVLCKVCSHLYHAVFCSRGSWFLVKRTKHNKQTTTTTTTNQCTVVDMEIQSEVKRPPVRWPCSREFACDQHAHRACTVLYALTAHSTGFPCPRQYYWQRPKLCSSYEE